VVKQVQILWLFDKDVGFWDNNPSSTRVRTRVDITEPVMGVIFKVIAYIYMFIIASDMHILNDHDRAEQMWLLWKGFY
jgi:hypothetical protein